MFTYSPAFKVLLTALGCVIVSAGSCYLGYMIFKSHKIRTAAKIHGKNVISEEILQ